MNLRNIFKEKEYLESLKVVGKLTGLVSICMLVIFLCSWALTAIIEVLNWSFWPEFIISFIGVCISVGLTLLVGFTVGYIFRADEW